VPLFVLGPGGSRKENLDLLGAFYFWFVPILAFIQAALLFVPVGIVQERPVKRRGIIVSAVIAAFPMAVLAYGFLYSIVLMLRGENKEFIMNWPAIIIIIAISWLLWGAVFAKNFVEQTPLTFTARITRWLLRGSILELVVAIPSHIISRHRRECCAPAATLFGIATGLAIALLSFGPGIFFLFARRIKNKKGKLHTEATKPTY